MNKGIIEREHETMTLDTFLTDNCIKHGSVVRIKLRPGTFFDPQQLSFNEKQFVTRILQKYEYINLNFRVLQEYSIDIYREEYQDNAWNFFISRHYIFITDSTVKPKFMYYINKDNIHISPTIKCIYTMEQDKMVLYFAHNGALDISGKHFAAIWNYDPRKSACYKHLISNRYIKRMIPSLEELSPAASSALRKSFVNDMWQDEAIRQLIKDCCNEAAGLDQVSYTDIVNMFEEHGIRNLVRDRLNNHEIPVKLLIAYHACACADPSIRIENRGFGRYCICIEVDLLGKTKDDSIKLFNKYHSEVMDYINICLDRNEFARKNKNKLKLTKCSITYSGILLITYDVVEEK